MASPQPEAADPPQNPGDGESGPSSSSNSKPNEDGRFECNICLDVAREAVVSMCGHLFCWPCLSQWLDAKPNQVCPVCKSAISRERVIPLYGRGGSNTDPRDRVPPRPQGQRQEPQQGPNVDWTGGWGGLGGGIGVGGGGVHFSLGIGVFPFTALWSQLFTAGGQQQQQQGGGVDGRRNNNLPPHGSRQQQEEQFLSNVFLWFAFACIMYLLIM